MKNIISIFLLFAFIYGREYFVSHHGNNMHPGTIELPLLTIQAASDSMAAGDICFIRQGIYHETVIMDDHDGMEGLPIVFASYENERVAMDGTVSIDSIWQAHSGNIWKTKFNIII